MDYCKSYLAKGNPVPKNFIDLIYALDEEEFAAYIQELKKEKRKSRNAKYYYNNYMIDDRELGRGGVYERIAKMSDEEFEEHLKGVRIETLKEKHFDAVVNYSWEKFEKYLQDVTVEWQRRHRSI